MGKMIINDMEKDWGRLIIVYGLSGDQVKAVEKCVPAKACEVYEAECFSDIIAFPQMASVISWDILTEDDKQLLVDYYSEVAPFSEAVILIGNVDIPNDLKKHIAVYRSFDEFDTKARYIFLNAYRKTKKNENYSVTLSNSLRILSEIRKNTFITTRELAEKLELSNRTVQRYIETLRVAGEWIEYDVSHKGWTLLAQGKSILWGDDINEDE